MNWPWRSSEPEGLLLRLLWLPLAIPAWFFRLGAAADRGGYLRRGPGRRRVDARVISVGSLLVGVLARPQWRHGLLSKCIAAVIKLHS